MTDQITSPTTNEIEPHIKTYNVTISFPPVLTRRHWKIYFNAKQKFIDVEQRAGRSVSAVEARFQGAIALIVAGIVHIDGLPEVIQWEKLADDEDANLILVGAIDTLVAIPVEAEMMRPLSAFFDKSSGSKTSLNISVARQP